MFSKIGSFKNIFKNNASDGGIWSWNNNGNWQAFDAAASKQIDNEIRNQWLNTKNQVLVFPLTKGPWFSQSKNRGIYFCNVQLNASRDKITSVVQQNTQTSFARNMTRKPLFAAPQKQHKKRLSGIFSKNKPNKNNKNNSTAAAAPSVTLQAFSSTVNAPVMSKDASVCWSWRNDYQWEAYDAQTMQQIETAYQSNAKSVVLDEGPFFGAKRHKGTYMIRFDEGNTIPPSYTQVNTKTNFGRQVARTEAGKSNMDTNDDNGVQSDKHYIWRPYYRPMTVARFKKLKDKEKICNICFLEFEEKELFENQCEEFKALVKASARKDKGGENTNNAMDEGNEEKAEDDTMKDEDKDKDAENENENGDNEEKAEDDTMKDKENKDEDNEEKAKDDTMKDEDKDADNENKNVMNEDKNEESENVHRKEEYEEDSDGDSVMLEPTDSVKDKEEKVETIETIETISEENEDETIQNEDETIETIETIENEDETIETIETIENEDETESKKEKEKEMDVKISRAIADKIENDTIIHLCKCSNDDHYFHTECIARWLKEKGKCCHCQKRYAVETGNQPRTGRLSWSFVDVACSGYKKHGSIKIGFEFEDGIQGEEHYHPGQEYSGDYREAYLPNNEAGREAFELTKIAWMRRLIFTVGASLTTKRENTIVWTSIHFKTRMDGGQEAHGWPDKTYFDRFKKELEAKGVTVDDIDDDAIDKIKNGY